MIEAKANPGEAMSAPKGDLDIPPDFDLRRPEEVLALAEQFQGEWYNGGFAQLFSNWYPADVRLIPDGLRAVGATSAAIIVESAISELGPAEQWRQQGHHALRNPSEPLSVRLRQLNSQLDKHFDHLMELIARFESALNENAEDEFDNKDGDNDSR